MQQMPGRDAYLDGLLGRLGRSEDLAPMALAVLSNRVSAYITGAAIVVDGGLSLTNWFDPPTLDDV